MKSAILGLLLVALTASGCGSDGDKTSDGSSKFGEQSEKAFMQSCEASSGGKRSYCECLFEKFESRYSKAEFAEIDRTILQDGVNGLSEDDREFLETATKDCVGG